MCEGRDGAASGQSTHRTEEMFTHVMRLHAGVVALLGGDRHLGCCAHDFLQLICNELVEGVELLAHL